MNHGSNAFVQRIALDLESSVRYTQSSINKLAANYQLVDKREIKELTELAIVIVARKIAHKPIGLKSRYDEIVQLYKGQVNLSFRNSMSILLQQYSTPAPIGFLMGIFCGLDRFAGKTAFEPSAGNGLLTVAGNPADVFVNEIDNFRYENLVQQRYQQVIRKDATLPFMRYWKKFDAVLTNPPFGKGSQPVMYDSYAIRPLEHIMALRALDCMRDDGKAAIIIGGHTTWDTEGRIQAGKNRLFFNYLYSHYYVLDVINIDGSKLYSRQGTSFDVRLILISGRKESPAGAAPLYRRDDDKVVRDFEDLYYRVTLLTSEPGQPAASVSLPNRSTLSLSSSSQRSSLQLLEDEAAELESQLLDDGELGAVYMPASQACNVLNTQVPDSMAFETQSALDLIRREVGGDMDNFVRDRLGYQTKAELCAALAAEQIDAVGMAIYNVEARNQGMIIGDQTGIGKGRVAAAMIRYACHSGHRPVFITEKANLFSDIYRDLIAIGSGALKPFIVNGREAKTDIKDENGNIIYQAPTPVQQQEIFNSAVLPDAYDFILATYTQFNSPDKKPGKPRFLMEVAENNIFILDEAHNSSGSSNTGEFLQKVVSKTKGVLFLSATFAKRSDNMPIYAMKTAIADCNMSKEQLVEAITYGGVALQEVLSSQLVAEGQMLRRERSFEGVEVNYLTLDALAQEHRAIADNITEILRDIIAFQGEFITSMVKQMDKVAAAEGKEIELRSGTSQAGVDNQPYFSKIFQVINQMLFSLKATAVADRAIVRLKEGKKPVIAFASTMGSFIESLDADNGMPVGDGTIINADFSEVLRRGLDGVLRYTVKDVDGNSIYKKFSLMELLPAGQLQYQQIYEQINQVTSGITISPIDVVTQIIKAAGYSVAEVTGRKFEVQLNLTTGMGLVLNRKKINTNDAFRQFNNNEVDVLLINQSGSTGASAHAIATSKVPKEQVKQRVMIVLQAELDINTEVQKRGRINRTGQLLLPIYDYVSSAIPAEKRLMMMLQKKLKSLDANTSSNQKQSSKILDVPDFLNKYGDKIVTEYLEENPEINILLDDPLRISNTEGGDSFGAEDAAHRVSGRVAVLSTKMQIEFYNDVSDRYNDLVDYLRQTGEYDLEVEAMELAAETVSVKVLKMGKGTDSAFGDDSVLETVKANVLRKPFSRGELNNLITDSLEGKEPMEIVEELKALFIADHAISLDLELQENKNHYQRLTENIPLEKKIAGLKDDNVAWSQAIAERESELEEAKIKKESLIRSKADNKKSYFTRLFKFFLPGRSLKYPIVSFGDGQQLVPAVFLGFVIDLKKRKPFNPSQVKLRFAIAGSAKYRALPASLSAEITSIIGSSAESPLLERQDMLDEWESYNKSKMVDRNIRHIITGNLLQAFAGAKGKLVSYTTSDHKITKGILLPESWTPAEQSGDSVVVPISKALHLIQSLVSNGQILTTTGISFFKQKDHFKIVVPGSRIRGGDIYLDLVLLNLVDGGNFQKVADKMVAELPERHISAFVNRLEQAHGAAVAVSDAQFREIQKHVHRSTTRIPIRLPEMELPTSTITTPSGAKVISLYELEAEALLLELELLAA